MKIICGSIAVLFAAALTAFAPHALPTHHRVIQQASAATPASAKRVALAKVQIDANEVEIDPVAYMNRIKPEIPGYRIVWCKRQGECGR